MVSKREWQELNEICLGNWESNESRMSVFVCQQIVVSAPEGIKYINLGNCCEI